MKLDIVLANRFKRDLRIAKKRGYDLDALNDIVDMLSEGKPLPAKNKDHSLSGNLKEFRECHILNDWILVYKIENDELILLLSRTGTHSDIFG